MAESRAFDKIRIGLASPEEVRGWSFGEVKKPETINYRTFKPERDGLFCERIFGPVKDWECHCGRYKKVKFKGIVCDRCGVEVTRSKVRRERMGHIELCAPVSHIWYLKGVPSPMALLLDLSPRPLEKVIYFGSYIVTNVDRLRLRRLGGDAVVLPLLDAIDKSTWEEVAVAFKPGMRLTGDVLNLLRKHNKTKTEFVVRTGEDAGVDTVDVKKVKPALLVGRALVMPAERFVFTGEVREHLNELGWLPPVSVTYAKVKKKVTDLRKEAHLDDNSGAGNAEERTKQLNAANDALKLIFDEGESRFTVETLVAGTILTADAIDGISATGSTVVEVVGASEAVRTVSLDDLEVGFEIDTSGKFSVMLPQRTKITASLAKALHDLGVEEVKVTEQDSEWDKIVRYVNDEMEERANAPAPTAARLASVTLPIDANEDEETLIGRTATDAVADPETGEILIEAGDIITQENLDTMTEAGIAELSVDHDGEAPIELTAVPRMLDEIAGDDLDAGLDLLQKVEQKELLVEDQYRQLMRVVEVLVRRSGDKTYSNIVKAGLGATAVRELLQEIDLDALMRELETEIGQTQGARRIRSVKRIEIVRSFLESKSRPEWMILDAIPVIPPELRPMVQLDGGRFATSDLNDLYRRIINRNNRLKKIQDIKAPESIINHEKRLLQEAVDALIDNGRRTRPVVGSNNRPLRSLSDMLKGKEGRFRKNLLGKRVDYSGRSVIVVGPTLKLNQCGLPKEMALELFKPFVMKGLVDAGCTTNIKTAKRMIDRVRPEVWDALEKVVNEHVVLLNRAPTLHRLGIQAFEPVLVDGKAIRLHPLVCAAFGADFDGDQMAVHVPLSSLAQAEGQCLMLSTRNLFKPSDGAPIVAPIQDIVLGLYYLTQLVLNAKGAGRMFSSVQEALLALETGNTHLHAPIKVRDYDPDDLVARYLAVNPNATDRDLNSLDPSDPELAGIAARCSRKLYDTTPGRLVISQIAPWMMRYPCERNAAKKRRFDKKDESISGVVQVEMDKKAVSALIRYTYEDFAAARTIELLDEVKSHGFTYATRSGMSISLTDMDEPPEREEIIKKAEDRVTDINRRYRRGAITAGEREGQVLEAWTGASADIGKAILTTIGKENPLFMMTNSGARGSLTQITQLSGMRGLMSDPFGGIIEELPIKSNFHRGLNILEYFVSTHGQRKGLADTALRTADAGYLTRRLVDVAQDVIVRGLDCETNRGIFVSAITEAGDVIETLRDRIRGRVALDDIIHPDTGGVLVGAGQEITDLQARDIDEAVRMVSTAPAEPPVTPKSATKPRAKSKKALAAEAALVDSKTGEATSRVVVDAAAWTPLLNDEGKTMKGINRVGLRSPLTCELRQGICASCYGRDMATQRTVEVGTAVGIIAAQSIGEPGTQLTMRTFHTGGVAGKNIVGVANVKQKKQEALRELHLDIERGHVSIEESAPGAIAGPATDRERSRAVQAMLKVLEEQVGGLLRVVELVEGRKPKGQAIITEVDGTIVAIEQKGSRRVIIHSQLRVDTGETNGKVLGESVVSPETGEIILEAGAELNEKASRLLRDKKVESVTVRHSHLVPYRGALEVRMGDEVHAGDRLTEGPLDPDRVLELQGITGVQDYMVKEVQSVYKSQGVDINDKHIEVIVRQMLKKRKIVDPGDTLFLPGQMVDKFEFEDANAAIREQSGTEATAEWLLLGITEASLATDSFLSAASFQKTTKVLADAAVRGKKDNLVGLKENVIIGRLIPAGTGLKVYRRMTVGGEDVRPALRRESARATSDPTIDELTAVLRGDTILPTESDIAGSNLTITDVESNVTAVVEYE